MEKTLLDQPKVCRRYCISRSTLWRRVKAGQVPAPTKINGQNYWLSEVIDEHILSLFDSQQGRTPWDTDTHD